MSGATAPAPGGHTGVAFGPSPSVFSAQPRALRTRMALLSLSAKKAGVFLRHFTAREEHGVTRPAGDPEGLQGPRNRSGETPSSWEPSLLCGCKEKSSPCFHHKHLPTACRGVIFRGNLAGRESSSSTERLDGLPLVPTLWLPSSERRWRQTRHPTRDSRGSHATAPHGAVPTIQTLDLATRDPAGSSGPHPEDRQDAYPRPACPVPGPRTSPGRCSSRCPGLSSSGTR